MKDRMYAVLCAGCAEKMGEFYEMEELPESGREVLLCCTCMSIGYYAKYRLTPRKTMRNAECGMRNKGKRIATPSCATVRNDKQRGEEKEDDGDAGAGVEEATGGGQGREV